MKQKIPATEKRMCRRLTRRQTSWKELLFRVTIINDPEKLAELSAELQRRKLRLSTTDAQN
jgi:hypothetical protein